MDAGADAEECAGVGAAVLFVVAAGGGDVELVEVFAAKHDTGGQCGGEFDGL